ncbi:Wzz/FepE/Etk N-terminal domain-containing protein [Thermoflavifilum thermophilum]|uniref:Chain length determinant protein n=1 Tax=Thermoflavifilum thermophilum TaxID=1393122 RepID=A0A1I7MYC7_9BACT|nr:Wzz/FepE/Etk N-terminal domain-containing protein [Thermoflavifilum thermophilum]SFV27394.1 Chain length determinant protein [Thermoflavifilum thermophilum]
MTETHRPIPVEDEISIKDLILKFREWIQYLRSKWLILLICGIVGAALGLVYSLVSRPKYIATLTFALEENSSNDLLSSYAGLASQFGFNLGSSGGVFSEDNIMQLMQSRLMITRTLLDTIYDARGRMMSLADYYIDMNHLRRSWKKNHHIPVDLSFPAGISADSLTYIQDSLMGKFCESIVKNYLDIEKSTKEGSIISVTCTAPDELFAKTFADDLVKHVSLFYIQTKTKRAASNLNVIQARLDSVRQAYHAALYGTAVSTDQNLNPARAIVSVPTITKQTQAQILGAEYAELVKNLEIARMTLLQETPLIQIIDRPILPLKERKVGKLKGLVLGGFIGGVIAIFILMIRKTYQDITKDI